MSVSLKEVGPSFDHWADDVRWIRISLVAGLGIVFEGYDQGVMSGVNISPSYIVSSVLFRFEVTYLWIFKDLMQIGDGATETITNASKQGGLVAIYYLGTLVGALMYACLDPFRTSDGLPSF